MHWIEGVIAILAGTFWYLIAIGAFPADPRQRANLERAMPVVKRRRLMYAAAVFLWLFGAAAVVNDLSDLGLGL